MATKGWEFALDIEIVLRIQNCFQYSRPERLSQPAHQPALACFDRIIPLVQNVKNKSHANKSGLW